MRERFIPHHAYPSPFAAWLDLQEPNEVTGSDDSPIGWMGRYGRHILTVDDRGYVTHERHATQSEACSAFATYDEQYAEWNADEDEETDTLFHTCAIHPDRNHSTGDLACEILSQENYYGTE